MMKTMVVSALAALLLVPAAFAAGADEDGSAADACKALQKSAPDMFGAGKTYRNLGACVSAKTGQAEQNASNAAKTCKQEQADANFAGGHGGKSFADFYGSNGNKRNAFGKCVSGKAEKTTDAQNAAELNTAKKCKAQRADAAFASSHGGKSFSDHYGTNDNKRNAFGKCVSALAKTA